MQEVLLRILNEYDQEKLKPLESNPLATYIRRAAPEVIRSRAAITMKYVIMGGPGQGNWAEIPWIGIFDSQITTSAQRGHYIVYLFRSDMSGVYLSLNMGWTQFENKYKPVREAQARIRDTSLACRELIRSSLFDFSYEPIDLITNRKLGTGYELGHICGKFYPINDVPEDGILVDDLRNLIGVYRELTGFLHTKDITNLLSIYGYEREKQEDYEDREYQRKIEKAEPKRISIGPQKKPEHTEDKGRIKWNTDAGIAKNCIAGANYECQVNPNHKTFTSEVTNRNYVEAHHLIPMKFQEQFIYSLDIPPNIVSLCPNCHSLFHHATDSERNSLIIQFISIRKDELEVFGIPVSVNQLLNMYKES